MHAFLVVGRDTNNVSQEVAKIISKNDARQLPYILQKIEDVRDLKKLIKFSFSEKTAIVINDIDKITPEAANAFLKNLEEPNNNLIYVLTASNLSNVLSTIISRCEIIRAQNLKSIEPSKKTNFKDALNIKDRDEAIQFVESYLIDLEPLLIQRHDLVNACDICLGTLKNLRANGNVSLQLANFIARMSSTTI